jgi:hypothetical protein
MKRTKSIPQQQAWVTMHQKRIIKHLDQLIVKLIREREAIALTLRACDVFGSSGTFEQDGNCSSQQMAV